MIQCHRQSSSKQQTKRHRSDSSEFQIFSICFFVCAKKHVSSHDLPRPSRKQHPEPVLPVDYQVKKSAFFFISEIPLQSTCFETQFYLTVFSSITYTTFHFEALCHSRKIPPKSFISSSLCFPLSLSRQVHTFTFLHLAIFFPILPPHFSPFRKSIFDFKLTCN